MQSTSSTPSPKSYFFQTLFSSTLGIAGFVLEILSSIFLMVGAGFWVVSSSTPAFRFTGWVFLGMGFGLMLVSFPLLLIVVQRAQKTAEILQNGLETTGHIINIRRNARIRVNQQHPWQITYSYSVNGELFEAQETIWTNPVGHEAETAVAIKYDPSNPQESRIQHPAPLN